MADTVFADAHWGDLIRIRDHAGGWQNPVRVLTPIRQCDCCNACSCKGVTPDGRTVPVHADGSTPVQVLDSLNPAPSEFPSLRAEAVAENGAGSTPRSGT